MSIQIPREIRAAMSEVVRQFGRQGGKTAARNMTPEERSARAKKSIPRSGPQAHSGATSHGSGQAPETEMTSAAGSSSRSGHPAPLPPPHAPLNRREPSQGALRHFFPPGFSTFPVAREN